MSDPSATLPPRSAGRAVEGCPNVGDHERRTNVTHIRRGWIVADRQPSEISAATPVEWAA